MVRLRWNGSNEAQRQADQAFGRLKNKKRARKAVSKKNRRRRTQAARIFLDDAALDEVSRRQDMFK